MILSTPGLVLHTTPYGEASVVAKVFTRQLGVRSYIVKGVRGPRGSVKQNLLQPLTSLDMVVYDNHKNDLNHIKEITLRSPLSTLHSPLSALHSPLSTALRFFMTEVLYKALREEEPMPELWDYVEGADLGEQCAEFPVRFMLKVAYYLGIEPLDNYCPHEPYFDLQEGRYVSIPSETTLPPALSALLHNYLSPTTEQLTTTLAERRLLLEAIIAYYQLHLSGFNNFHSHEILHTILR